MKKEEKKQTCYKKDDLFARDENKYGYMQCQVHLRNSYNCYRPKNKVVLMLRKHIKKLNKKQL